MSSQYPDCDKGTWKIGFARGTGRDRLVNVRSAPSTAYPIVDVLSATDRKIVEWNEDQADGDWYPVRIHKSGNGLNYKNGWVHSGFAYFEEINNCKVKPDLIPNEGDANRFLDLPLPGYPTLFLNGKERLTIGQYMQWLSLVFTHAPYDFSEDGEIDLKQLLASTQQLEATIKLALPLVTKAHGNEDDNA